MDDGPWTFRDTRGRRLRSSDPEDDIYYAQCLGWDPQDDPDIDTLPVDVDGDIDYDKEALWESADRFLRSIRGQWIEGDYNLLNDIREYNEGFDIQQWRGMDLPE